MVEKGRWRNLFDEHHQDRRVDPAGLGRRGFEPFTVQDLILAPQVIRVCGNPNENQLFPILTQWVKIHARF